METMFHGLMELIKAPVRHDRGIKTDDSILLIYPPDRELDFREYLLDTFVPALDAKGVAYRLVDLTGFLFAGLSEEHIETLQEEEFEDYRWMQQGLSKRTDQRIGSRRLPPSPAWPTGLSNTQGAGERRRARAPEDEKGVTVQIQSPSTAVHAVLLRFVQQIDRLGVRLSPSPLVRPHHFHRGTQRGNAQPAAGMAPSAPTRELSSRWTEPEAMARKRTRETNTPTRRPAQSIRTVGDFLSRFSSDYEQWKRERTFGKNRLPWFRGEPISNQPLLPRLYRSKALTQRTRCCKVFGAQLPSLPPARCYPR